MPYNDELDRDYTKKEARLWREVRHQDQADPFSPEVVKVARGFGIHEERARQHARTWQNDGLVVLIEVGSAQVTLTKFGRRFTFEERYSDIEG